jgi:hypothetical protein
MSTFILADTERYFVGLWRWKSFVLITIALIASKLFVLFLPHDIGAASSLRLGDKNRVRVLGCA